MSAPIFIDSLHLVYKKNQYVINSVDSSIAENWLISANTVNSNTVQDILICH